MLKNDCRILLICKLMASISQPGGEATTFTLPGFLANQAFRAALGGGEADEAWWEELVDDVNCV